jgi:hypothetical protein
VEVLHPLCHSERGEESSFRRPFALLRATLGLCGPCLTVRVVCAICVYPW